MYSAPGFASPAELFVHHCASPCGVAMALKTRAGGALMVNSWMMSGMESSCASPSCDDRKKESLFGKSFEELQHTHPAGAIVLAGNGLVFQRAVRYSHARAFGDGREFPANHRRLRGMLMPVRNPAPDQQTRGTYSRTSPCASNSFASLRRSCSPTAPWSA